MRTILVSLLIAGFALSNTACIGRMAVSGIVREFNLDVVEGKWQREIVFLALYVIPVYPVAGAIDLIIVNSLEFWSGTNPVNGKPRLARVGDQKYVVAADGSQAISTLREDRSIDIELRGPDGDTHFMNVVRTENGVVARDSEGREIAIFDPTTGEVQSLSEHPQL